VLFSKRSWLTAVAAFVGGCSRPQPSEEQRAVTPPGPDWREESFDSSPDQPEGQRALLFAPNGSSDWPVLVALHGRGEAGRGLAAGAHGWRDDYDLDVIRARLEAGALSKSDAKEMLTDERIARHRASLAKHAWQGLRIVCPYTPVPSGGPDAWRSFANFVDKSMLPRVTQAPDRAKTGIDGVSMGGRYALELGFGMAQRFGAVGALQPAIREADAEPFAERAEQAAGTHGKQSIQLVTSSGDPFRAPTEALSAALARRSIAHQLIVTDGPHDYIWNRGPGAVEMLMFHERVLRGLEPV